MKTGIRLWILIVALAVAAWYVLSPLLFSAAGLKVVSIVNGASCGNLRVGDVITNIGGSRTPTLQDFQAVVGQAKSGDRVVMLVNGGPGGCTAVANGDLGVTVQAIGRSWLRLGTDIDGGDRFTIAISALSNGETPAGIADVLDKRLDVLGLKDAYTSVDGNTIYAYLPKGDSVNSVLFHGKLESFAKQSAALSGNATNIKIGQTTYTLSWNGNNVTFGNGVYAVGQRFNAGGVQVEVSNYTNTSLTVDELIFNNSGVGILQGQEPKVAYDSSSTSYVFSVPVELSSEASKNFMDVVGGLAPLYGSSQGLLNGVLVYSVDGTELSRLSIPSSILSSQVTSLSMTGNDIVLNNALYKERVLKMSLEGVVFSDVGAQPSGSFEGTMGWVVPFAEMFAATCVVALFVVTFALDRRVWLSLFSMAVPLLEIMMIIAVAEMSQALTEQGWVVDAPTLAGICVVAASSVLLTVLLTEKAVKSRFAKTYMWSSIAVIALGAVLSFTALNRVGLAIMFGGIAGYAVVKPFYEEFAVQFKR